MTRFSLIVPSYNDPFDVVKTLNSIKRQVFEDYEVICIDDSNDDKTWISINKFIDLNGFRCISQLKRKGLNQAYNLGIEFSKGEIIIFLTSDNILPSLFLHKLNKVYEENNVDCINVRNQVSNVDSLPALIMQAREDKNYYKSKKSLRKLLWSEGFSVKRKFVMLNDIRFDESSVYGGNDNLFVQNLINNKASRYISTEIICEHIVPSGINSIFFQYFNRGKSGSINKLKLKSNKFVHIKIILKYLIYLNFIIPISLLEFFQLKFKRKLTFSEKISCCLFLLPFINFSCASGYIYPIFE